MSLQAKIDDWKKYANALGSESQVAVIVGEVAERLGDGIPDDVRKALKVLALRGTMRDIAMSIQRDEPLARDPHIPSFHEVVDAGAASCGLSWAEAIAAIVSYLNQCQRKLG
jgi:hypothetical protein